MNEVWGQYIVGHRGAMGLAPENTLKAFKIGCESNADVVECDIHLSKDKKLVVFHDNTLDRTTNGSGWLRDFTLGELKRLNAGEGEQIPALEEVVDLAMGFKKKLIIEIKSESLPVAQETADALCGFLRTAGISKNIIVHSFWHDAVKNVKQNLPEVLTAVIMMVGLSPNKQIFLIKDALADGASINYDYISPELVSLAGENNLFLDAWVLDYPFTFERMRNMGVNGMITNYPGKFKL